MFMFSQMDSSRKGLNKINISMGITLSLFTVFLAQNSAKSSIKWGLSSKNRFCNQSQDSCDQARLSFDTLTHGSRDKMYIYNIYKYIYIYIYIGNLYVGKWNSRIDICTTPGQVCFSRGPISRSLGFTNHNHLWLYLRWFCIHDDAIHSICQT